MLGRYQLGGEEVDSLELKSLLVTNGVKVSNEVYQEFAGEGRIYPDPLKCNCVIFPDDTVAQLTDVALHLRYLKQAMSLDSLGSVGTLLQAGSAFELKVSTAGRPLLTYKGADVTDVRFPPPSRFYDQKTSEGLPFLGNAVLQGIDTLSFQCLWPCEYARAGFPCQFCYSGGISWRLAKKHMPEPSVPTLRDVAEIYVYAVREEKQARVVQVTGGSTLDPEAECGRIRRILEEIDSFAGLSSLEGEMLIYTSPPREPKTIDQVFDAGADRVACSLEVWDEKLASFITPGKIRFAGRERFLNCLKYISKEYGPGKACSSFVVGVGPAESFLEGAEYLATQGIATIASLWIPFGRPVMGKSRAPGLDYYRKVKEGLMQINCRYGVEPPGEKGFNVCLCRDAWNHRSEKYDLGNLRPSSSPSNK